MNKEILIYRDEYLKKIRSFYGFNFIKILIGGRRSGKSKILESLINIYKKENVIFYNMDDIENSKYKHIHVLAKDIKSKTLNHKNNNIFIDEIDNVKDWEILINSLYTEKKYNIIITGSNSKMLSSDLSTKLAGRFVEIEIFPFNYSEVKQYFLEHKIRKTKNEIFEFLMKFGGMSQIYNTEDDEDKIKLLDDIYNSTILNDIVERYNVKNVILLKKVLAFIIDSISNSVSAKNIYDQLIKNGENTSKDQIYMFVQYALNVFLINELNRYDINGKEHLKTLSKFYLSNLGYRTIIKKDNKELGRVLENLIFIELISRGYEFYIGKVGEKEIDFYIITNKNKYYLQVCYKLNYDYDKPVDQQGSTYNREYKPLMEIKDFYKRIVVSLDKNIPENRGIIHINVIDFLENIRGILK